MKNELILPVIDIKNGKERYDLDWDFVSDKSNDILFESEHEYYLKAMYGRCSFAKPTIFKHGFGRLRKLHRDPTTIKIDAII